MEKELASYFPEEFRSTERVEYNSELIKKLRLEVDQVVNGNEDHVNEIFQHERRLLGMGLPNVWNVNKRGNMEVEMEVGFEKFIFGVSEHTNQDVGNMNVFSFNSILEFIKSKSKKDK